MTILASLLKTHKVVSAPVTAPVNADPVTSRRMNFIRRLKEQLQLLERPNMTRSTKIWKKDANGQTVTQVVEVNGLCPLTLSAVPVRKSGVKCFGTPWCCVCPRGGHPG